jgi:hypothetical protein
MLESIMAPQCQQCQLELLHVFMISFPSGLAYHWHTFSAFVVELPARVKMNVLCDHHTFV